MSETLAEKVRRFPAGPGVYLIKDAAGRVIYVGKARSLRQRVRSYLAESGLSPRLQALQNQMKDIEYIVTDSEVEALILECNLIKENRPRYNINLKDDKDYPYLRLTAEPYPRLEILRLSQREGRRSRGTRRRERSGASNNGAVYFGPYTSAGAVRETLRLLGKIFPLRRCRQTLTGEPSAERPCLNFQMKRCLGPCRGAAAVPPREYAALVRQVTLFLEGRQSELVRQLERRMDEAARQERYEEAARLRDQLQAVRRVAEQQQKALEIKKAADQDVLALVRLEREAAVQLFKIREGKLLGQDYFPLSGAFEVEDPEALGAFIKSYYSRGARPPQEIVLSHPVEDEELLQQWLKRRAGRRVVLLTPRRGYRKKLVELARRNGLLKMEEERRRSGERELLPLRELARLAGLENEPRRIEGYDISHLRGGEAVGSMVVFEQGRSFKEGYRHFHLRQTPPGDDYAALREVLHRRAARDDWPCPDLILVDGGAGQLGAAREALDGTGLAPVPLLSLAKDPDRVFFEGAPAPLLLPAGSTLLQLLQRVRDEAHRFALDYHRRRRRRSATRSLLEGAPGIGPKRRAALLAHFGSMEELYRAGEAQLRAVQGIGPAAARRLYDYLHGES